MKKNYGPLLVFVAAVLWSSSGVITKYSHLSALSLACMRGTFAALAIGLIYRKWVFKPTPAVLLGAFCSFCTSLILMLSNKLTTAANAIILQYTAPVFVMIFSALFMKVVFSKLDIITAVLTILGISLFFFDHLGNGAILGDLLALFSGITFAGVFLANKLPGANPVQASYLGCLMGILLLPFMFTDPEVIKFNVSELILGAVMGVFQLGIAYAIFSKGIRTTPAFSASIICTIEPILNPIWVFLVIGEKPSVLAITGAGIVVLTIACYNMLSIKRLNMLNAGKNM